MLFSILRQLTENYPEVKSHEELTEPKKAIDKDEYLDAAVATVFESLFKDARKSIK